MPNITPTSAVVFDLDGTLLDTLTDLTDTLNAVLARHGHPGHPPSRVQQFIGCGAPTLVRRALPEAARDDREVNRVNEAFVSRYRQHWADTTAPYRGVEATLDRLTAAEVPLAILSNKPHEFTKKIVHHLLGKWPWVEVWGADPSRPLKPEPDQALVIAQALGVAPSRVVFVGDSGVDMRTAAAAGMVGVGALWGFRTRAQLVQAGARHLIERPEQLPPILDELAPCAAGQL